MSGVIHHETRFREGHPISVDGSERWRAADALWVIGMLTLWAATTSAFWIGYTGADDVFYSRYALHYNRPPINWWEGRMLYVLAIRGAFLMFGPTEFAACAPGLLASLVIVASVAWYVGWPANRGWVPLASVALAVVLPYNVSFRTVPGATFFATGFLAAGSVAVLSERSRTQLLGAALLALGFAAHEASFYYIALLCLSQLVIRGRAAWRPVLACVAFSGLLVAIESASYAALTGDPWLRFRIAMGESQNQHGLYDPDMKIGGLAFLIWPLKSALFCKPFGFALVLLFAAGMVAWRRLDASARTLWLAMFLTWLWLGYGTKIPWSYKPFARQHHLYFPLAFGAPALLPLCLRTALPTRERVAAWIAGLLILSSLALSALGGSWGQGFETARKLLAHAREHKGRVFLASVSTMNHMYVAGGFQLPENVVCLNGEAVERHLLINKEPAGTPRFRFPERRVDGVLINKEPEFPLEADPEMDPQYHEFLAGRRGKTIPIPPDRGPLARLIDWVFPTALPKTSFGGAVLILDGHDSPPRGAGNRAAAP